MHRDLKPQNILITEIDKVIIADFTTAKIIKKGDKLKGTEGTDFFMSPESLRDTTGEGYCGIMSDLWSLGVTFYCLMYLKLPFFSLSPL
jgi:serine/threonine protein kinase